MLVQFNSDRNIEGTDALALDSEQTIRQALTHFSEHVTRIEMHVSDENSGKNGGTEDIRCLIEARLSGRAPIAVTHSASTVEQSVDGAADKMKRAIEGVIGRRDAVERKRRTSQADARHDLGAPVADRDVSKPPVPQADGGTRRAESPTLEGRVPLPEEITGRASATSEDLVELFENPTGAHLTDGFRGGSEGEALDQSNGADEPGADKAR